MFAASHALRSVFCALDFLSGLFLCCGRLCPRGSRLLDRILSGLGKGRVEGLEAALSRTLPNIPEASPSTLEPHPGEQPHTGHISVLWIEETLADSPEVRLYLCSLLAPSFWDLSAGQSHEAGCPGGFGR